ncbi:prepilin-type N-terminal cleavage/methylation domain-containing protein [Ramlibacter sp. G-1-2-2]|uniref:Prepilin-type N-terminal cleavage/methylation domain-containing protein n=1 Tax=Ramlibacter agri TaxID=2728837 RepID=A0A848HD42_9BURK|nr:prepilin-type N-terminal cleavage/methylation domain-containing protein [Ramlibacter agri]NML48384.1 prepilin-type N-terminal cleavage/methylation domain-containing protein [Ramlibacter agri]
MPTSAPGSKRHPGFTLLELMVVVAIVAVASAGVSFALRDAAGQPLERDAQRLAALLDSARAQSRLTGQPVRWIATETGFRFDGLPAEKLPRTWLTPDTHVQGPVTQLVLGPEPIIGPQAVVLTSADHPERSLVVATDGLRPFAVGPLPQ